MKERIDRQYYIGYLSGVADGLNQGRQDTIAELEKIKAEIQGLIDFEESCCESAILGYECLDVIDKYISELKGENNEM